jgi:HK97 family phage portal protein
VIARSLQAMRTKRDDPRRAGSTLWLPQQVAGITLTLEDALSVSVVWGCVDAITKALVSSAWRVYEVEARRRLYRPDDAVGWLLDRRPNPEATAVVVREALLITALTGGNGYAEIERSGGGRPVALWPLFADRVVPQRTNGGTGDLYYEYYQPSGGVVTIPAADMFHLRGPSLDGVLGMNMVARAAKVMGLAVAAERFGSAYFANSTVMSGVLEYPGAMDDETHDRLKKDWLEKKGPAKAHAPVILENGMKWVSISNDAEHAQLIEARRFQVEEICRFFGVPPHKIQHLDRATFSNIEHLGIEFVRDAITPWAKRLEQEADFKLFPQRAPWRETKLDVAWLAYGDAKSRAEAQQVWRRIGVFSANDILEMEGRNTIGPEGDVRLVEANMTTYEGIEAGVEKMRAEAERAAEPPSPVVPGAPVDPEAEPEDGAIDPPPKKENGAVPRAQVRDAIALLLAGSLARYGRRLTNRQRDLERGRPRPVDLLTKMTEARAAARPALLEELREALDILRGVSAPRVTDADLTPAADAVDCGSPPELVARTLIETLEVHP